MFAMRVEAFEPTNRILPAFRLENVENAVVEIKMDFEHCVITAKSNAPFLPIVATASIRKGEFDALGVETARKSASQSVKHGRAATRR